MRRIWLRFQIRLRAVLLHLARRTPSSWHTLRKILWRGGALLGSFLLFSVLLIGGAGWYTSRSEFCNSCHIMEPYYKSWQESPHKDVPCIECHFPPGFGGKIRGKMLGLVQLIKYVTKSEGPRPAAEISDASCLRSGCHETRLLTGKVDFRGIAFDHTPHLLETRRAKKLRCTSCHSQIVQGSHMTVTSSTCFLCHFKGEQFNEGLGACTHCHQIPEGKIDLGGGVTITHDLAYEKGVDCIYCHGDVIRGNGQVSKERCIVCHNRENDLKRIDDHAFMHEKHVTDHKIDCLDCHLAIDHSLDKDKTVHAADDCQSCHPKHHHEQVEMLRGVGAKSIPAHESAMTATRAGCLTCHRVKGVSVTGTVAWTASAQMCSLCHDATTVKIYEDYHAKLRASLPDLEAAVARTRKALESAGLPAGRQADITGRLGDIQHDLDFLRTANDIHNLHYANKLFLVLVDRVAELCRDLKTPEPKVELPRLPKHNPEHDTQGSAAGGRQKASAADKKK